MEKHLQQLVLHELMEAMTLARNGATVIRKSEATSNYRELQPTASPVIFMAQHTLHLLLHFLFIFFNGKDRGGGIELSLQVQEVYLKALQVWWRWAWWW